jgi:hypothetical protein
MLYPVELSDPIRFVAERGGFEPPVQNNPYDSLANYWFQPLTHLSKKWFFFLPTEKRVANISELVDFSTNKKITR